ncbi:hypothetical protein GOBAR_AA33179 [Gossypium barbadense]|uniref:Uncharacterized protein n=1 Tax=Gossypium barbadense TaxID=3634 RepID=A0A2P5W8X4_GOSBA|nr:hypothetical protein GOBAR_AA33179 [Gossypium barbadense]
MARTSLGRTLPAMKTPALRDFPLTTYAIFWFLPLPTPPPPTPPLITVNQEPQVKAIKSKEAPLSIFMGLPPPAGVPNSDTRLCPCSKAKKHGSSVGDVTFPMTSCHVGTPTAPIHGPGREVVTSPPQRWPRVTPATRSVEFPSPTLSEVSMSGPAVSYPENPPHTAHIRATLPARKGRRRAHTSETSSFHWHMVALCTSSLLTHIFHPLTTETPIHAVLRPDPITQIVSCKWKEETAISRRNKTRCGKRLHQHYNNRSTESRLRLPNLKTTLFAL